MPEIDKPHLIEIDIQGDRARISQSEYDPSLDEWDRRRTEAFAHLRTFDFIPVELLDLVERFKHKTLVQPYLYRPGVEVAFRFGVEVLSTQEEGDKAQRLAEMIATHKRLVDESEEKAEMTASEALAYLLRMLLRELKHAEKTRKAAPVRTMNLVPRSLIAEIGMDLLSNCATFAYPPGSWLNSLIRELLNLEHDRSGMSRNVDGQEKAAEILAQNPALTTRELARALQVNASTISRWRRSPEFKRKIEGKAKIFKDSANVADSIRQFIEEDPNQKEAMELLIATAAFLNRPKGND